MQDSMLSAALILIILGLFGALIQVNLELTPLKQRLRKYDTLTSREEFEQQLDSNIHLKRNELADLERQQELLNTQIKSLEHKSRKLDAKLYLQSQDAYEPQYDFIKSEDYVIQLKNIKSQQEEMRKKKRAFICNKEVTIDGNKKEGEKMMKDLLKLIGIAFETQCEYAIRDVKYSNRDNLKRKINDTFENINILSTKTGCNISSAYLDLKLRELDLKYELEQKKQEERDKMQELQKQNQERKKIEKARQIAEEAEERENIHQKELEILQKQREQIEQHEGEQRRQLEFKINDLERQLTKDKSDKEKAYAESTRLKQGIIYIVSNIGSLGGDIYRICMTKSGEPERYINNMNPATPFKFDIHFKILSEDALDTLERLHRCFATKRINIVNKNKEFFKVSINEIEEAVQEIRKKTGILTILEYEPTPQADEYYQTLFAHKKYQNLTSKDTNLKEDGIA